MANLGVFAEPVLVGREKELGELQRFLSSAIEGKGRTIFVSGEAGSGKTRLSREFLNNAVKQGLAVMAGWCLSDSQVPYFPFMEAFNNYYAASGKGETSLLQTQAQLGLGTPGQIGIENGEFEINSWLAGPKPARPAKPQALSPQAWKDQVFAAVSKTLHTIAIQNPVILFIEDVQWADSASLALLHYIAKAVNDTERVLVLATFRSEELTSDVEGRPHPLAETLRMMRREELFNEIELSSLNRVSICKVAESMMGGSLHQQLAGKLEVESRGNPLFVVESLRMLHERKSLIQDNNEWRLAVDELGIPSKIKDIILRRLACLKYAQRRVLDAASVIGEEFDVELLSTVLGQDVLDVLETLNVIAHSTSLVCVEGNRYRFDHARSRETLYEELSPPLKCGYHNRIAEKLESSKSEALPLSDLAFHYARAGNEEKAVKFALLAGYDALARWSNAEAIKQFTYVLKALGDSKRIAEKMSALEGLGDAFYADSMFKDATRTFAELANSATTDLVRLRAYRKAMEAAFQYGDSPYLMELVKKAEQYTSADRLENARVLMSRGRSIGMSGMLPAALKDWEAALQVFEEEYSLWDVAWALIAVGINHAQFADTESAAKQGLAEALRSIAIFEDLGDSRWQMEACWVAGIAFSNCLLESEAVKILAKVAEIDEKMKMGDYFRLTHANVWPAWFFQALGDYDKGLAFGLKALELSDKTDSPVAHGMVYSNLTVLYALLGDSKRSEEYFEKLMKLPPEIVNNINIQPEFLQPVVFAAKNQWRESNRLFEETLEQLKRRHLPLPAILKLKRLYAWALEKQGRFEEATILFEENQRAHREAEEKFAHASVQANLTVRRQVVAGEEFEMRLDLVNVGRKPALLVEVKNALLDDFKVVSSSSWCSIQDSVIRMANKEIGAFQVNTIKLTLRGLKPGTFMLNPQVVYIDDSGETKTCKLGAITVTVQPAKSAFEVLPNRVTTGFAELDALLFGGIPSNYAVALTSPSTDESESIVKRFLEVGAKANETTFYVTAEAGDLKELVENYPSSFFLFICNPQADTIIQSLSNVFKLKGVESLTEIDIALTKALRTLSRSAVGPRRICLRIISDVLLQHHAINTRKWLSALLPTLKSKNFTILAVVNPQIHSLEELQAVLSVFDGEIRVAEKETSEGTKQTLKIKKLINQKYSDKEIILNKQTLTY